MLPVILEYVLFIHSLQGSACDNVILIPEEKELGSDPLLAEVRGTKTYQGLAFHPPPPPTIRDLAGSESHFR